MKVGKALVLVVAGMLATLVVPSLAAATWSGENGKIFFSCRTAGGSFNGVDICSMNPDGSALVNLTNTPTSVESTPQVSQDGRQVTFTRRGGTDAYVWAMNADGSNPRQISDLPGDGPSWTPDGKIGFRAQTGTNSFEFQIAPANGGSGTFLHEATGSHFPPRFRRDGVWLYGALAPIPPLNTMFSQQIFTVDGSSENQVSPFVSGEGSNNQPSWSPDGSRIYYWRATGGLNDDIYWVPAGGGSEVQVTNTQGQKENWPSLSPDGKKLLMEQQDAEHDFFHKHLVIANPDGSGKTPIPTPSLDAAMSPFWAPVPKDVKPKAAFTATAPKKVKQNKPAPVTLRCIGDTRCAVAYSATVTVPRKGKKPQIFKAKAKQATLNAKAKKLVKIQAPGSAKGLIRKAIKAKKTPAFKVTATARQPGGPQIRKVNLTIRITG